MFCPKCGQLNLDKVESCQKCGAKLPVTDGASVTAAAPQAVVATGIYAGFWKRFAAFIIDYLVVVALSMVTGFVIGFVYGLNSPGDRSGIAEGLGGLAGIVVWWIYYASMESSGKQATLGKMALGIKVVNLHGARISFLRATGRNIAKILSGMILMIGYIMAGATARKQALHDMVAGCLVVNRGAPEERIRQGVREAGMPVWAIVLIVLGVLIVPVAILAAVAIPAYQDFTMRSKVVLAIGEGRKATQAVEEFYARNKKLPGSFKETEAPALDARHVSGVSVDPTAGAVRIVLANKALEGKSILFEPSRDGDGRIVWTCSSSEVQKRYLPANCRK